MSTSLQFLCLSIFLFCSVSLSLSLYLSLSLPRYRSISFSLSLTACLSLSLSHTASLSLPVPSPHSLFIPPSFPLCLCLSLFVTFVTYLEVSVDLWADQRHKDSEARTPTHVCMNNRHFVIQKCSVVFGKRSQSIVGIKDIRVAKGEDDKIR